MVRHAPWDSAVARTISSSHTLTWRRCKSVVLSKKTNFRMQGENAGRCIRRYLHWGCIGGICIVCGESDMESPYTCPADRSVFKRLSDQQVFPVRILPNTSFTGRRSENDVAPPYGLSIELCAWVGAGPTRIRPGARAWAFDPQNILVLFSFARGMSIAKMLGKIK